MRFSERMKIAHTILQTLARQMDSVERGHLGNELMNQLVIELDWDQGWDALQEDVQEVLAWMLDSYPLIRSRPQA